MNEVEGLDDNGRVRVRLNDGSETVAEVEHVSPVADGESGLIEVRVLIDNPERKILGSRCSLLLESRLSGDQTTATPQT